MKKFILGGVALIVLLLAGFFVPIDTYTTNTGCPIDPVPTERLHLIAGDSLQEVKDLDQKSKDAIYEGCFANTKYVLYVL